MRINTRANAQSRVKYALYPRNLIVRVIDPRYTQKSHILNPAAQISKKRRVSRGQANKSKS